MLWVWSIAAVFGCGLVSGCECGARRGIGVVSKDGGPDAETDTGTDEPPTAICPDEMYATASEPAILQGGGQDDHGIAAWSWRIVSAPTDSTAQPDPTDEQVTVLIPDVSGDYVVELTVHDTADQSATCQTTVHGVVSEPVAVCPEPQFTEIEQTVALHGEAYDDGSIVSVLWEIVSAPAGSTAVVADADQYDASLTPDLPGIYEIRLTVTDDEGFTGSCTTQLNVGQVPIPICPQDMSVPTRTEITLQGEADDDGQIVSWSWEVLSHDTDTDPTLTDADEQDARFWALRVGLYQLRLTVVDDDGLSNACEFTITTTPTGPTALCPPDIDTVPLTTVDLVGDGEDDGEIVDFQWSLISLPPGSAAEPPSPASGALSSFYPDIVGQYQLQLTVIDDDDNEASCQFYVNANPTGGLRVELFWNPPEDPSDMSDVDAHLLHPTSPHWFNWDGDCYYANCNFSTGQNLDWDVQNYLPDNPRLDLDDIDGYGPENINIDEPVINHTYRVGIHYFNDGGWGPSQVYVKVYCGNVDVNPIFELGPVTLETGPTSGQNDFWKVADLEWTGFGCDVTPIDTIVTSDNARNNR
jgi:hypothetical protein